MVAAVQSIYTFGSAASVLEYGPSQNQWATVFSTHSTRFSKIVSEEVTYREKGKLRVHLVC
jgi:hypothetical protein